MNRLAHTFKNLAKHQRITSSPRFISRTTSLLDRNMLAPLETSKTSDLHSPAVTMDLLTETSFHKLHRSTLSIFSSSVLGGALLGYGCMIYLAVMSYIPLATLAPLIGAMFFPIGLMAIVFTGTDLLTSNFMYGVLPFMKKEGTDNVSTGDVAKLWAVSCFGNLVGSIGMAAFASMIMPASIPWAAVAAGVALKKVHLSFGIAFLKGIAANWLVNLAIYMSQASSSVTGKVLSIWIPIATFVALQFEHSIANMFLIPLGLMVGGDLTWTDFFVHNLIPVIAGNAVGGAICVGMWQSVVNKGNLHLFDK